MFAKNSKAYSVYLLFRFVCSLAVSMSTVVGDKSLKDKNIRSKHRKRVPLPYFRPPALRRVG